MRPDLLLRYLRKKQIKDNKKRFAQKNLHFSVDSLYDLNYMGDSNPDHNLDIHSPQNTVGELPVLLVIHGGGYTQCEKFVNDAYSKVFAEKGYRVVNMNYSLQPEADFIEVMREIFAALHWIEANAQNYGFDCSRLFVTGDSAGGHYAMLVAAIQKSVQLQEYYQIRPVDSGIRGVVANCPMTELYTAKDGKDATSRFLRKYVLKDHVNDETYIKNISIPYLLDKKDLSGIMIITSKTDPLLYEEDCRLHKIFVDAGVSHVYKEYVGREHVLGHVFNVLDPDWEESQEACQDMCEYFSKC